MDQADGDAILREVRGYYKFGYKSSDKIYVLNDVQKANKNLLEKAHRREMDRNRSEYFMRHGDSDMTFGNAPDMARRAAEAVTKRGGVAHLGKVCSPGSHTFCVSDYPAGVMTPGCVADMCEYDHVRAWIIDPWMNVSCRFSEYPARAATKLAIWSSQGKHIIFRRDKKAYDPLDRAYTFCLFKLSALAFYTLNGDII